MVLKPWTVMEQRRAIEMLVTMTAKQVAQKIGRTVHSVYQLSYKMKTEHQQKRKKGELESIVRELHSQKLSDGQIADRLNVNAETIFKVRKRLNLKANYPRGCPKGFWNRRNGYTFPSGRITQGNQL